MFVDDPGAALAQALAAAPEGDIGIAVSGGGDSVALMLLMRDWASARGRTVAAVTVDHRLRPESAAEAEAVAAIAASQGISHATLAWTDDLGRGNLQARARDARRRLIADWARARDMPAVALGHTQDDQAETFLMRLARGSGVDGLAAIAPVSQSAGLIWLRPLLAVPRESLRGFLRARGVAWAEDPSNADPDFARIRARSALGPLAELGMTQGRLAETAAAMARAREALDIATAALARDCLAPGPAGDLALDPRPLASAPEEIRLRLLAGALNWVSGARYRPRLARLLLLAEAVASTGIGGGMTLHGCVLRRTGGGMAIRREPAAVAAPVPASDRRWDGRWELARGPSDPGLTIGAIGVAGLGRRPRWRESGLAREALLAAPALWQGQDLVTAPVLDGAEVAAFRRISALRPPWGCGVSR